MDNYTVTTRLMLDSTPYLVSITKATEATAQFAATAKAANASAAVDAAKASASIQQSMKGMGVTGALAAIGITVALGHMVSSAMETEAQLESMKVALDNVGLAEAGDRFEKMANSNTTLGFTVNQTASSLQKFATLTHDANDAVRLNALAMDMARAKHTDLGTATAGVQMMLRGASKGFMQYGVTLDSTLPKTKAIQKALNEVQEKVKGQAEKYLDTAAGKMDALKASFGQVADVIGKAVLPMLTSLLTAIQRFLPEIAIFMAMSTAIYAIVKAVKIYNEVLKVTKTLQIAVAALNPWQWIAIGVVALIAVIAVLWNRFKVVRDIVIDIANVGLHAFGDLVKFMGWVAEHIIGMYLKPLRIVLMIASHIPKIGKVAQTALDEIDKGINGIGNTADTVGNKINSFQKTLDKLRNYKIVNPFDNKSGKIDDTSYIDVTPLATDKIDTTAADLAQKYQDTLKSLNDDIQSALDDLAKTRQDGATAISAIITSSFGEPTDLQKAFDVTKATADTVIGEYDKLRSAINDRMAGYATADKARVLDTLKTQTSLMLDLIKSRDLLAKQIADAESLQSGEVDQMAKSLIGYGVAAGILQTQVSDTVIRIIRTASGAIITQGGETLNAVDSITNALKNRLASMTSFMANIKTLQSRGLNSDYIKQLLSGGIEGSSETVAALASASDAQISVINSTYSQITKSADEFANTTGANLYNSGITNLSEYIAGLKSQQSALESQMNQITSNVSAQMAKIVPMSANIGKDSATELLTNFSTYINDPKNQAAVLANAESLAKKIKEILGGALSTTPLPETPVTQPKITLPPVDASGFALNNSLPGKSGSGAQFGSSTPWAIASANFTFQKDAITVDGNGNPNVDSSKVTTDWRYVSNYRGATLD